MLFKGQQIAVALGAWALLELALLALFGSLDYAFFYVIAFLGFLVVAALASPYIVRPRWKVPAGLCGGGRDAGLRADRRAESAGNVEDTGMSKSKPVLKGPDGSDLMTETGEHGQPLVIRDTRVRRRLIDCVGRHAGPRPGAVWCMSYANGLGHTESLFLTIAGIAVVTLSILFYYFSPSRSSCGTTYVTRCA